MNKPELNKNAIYTGDQVLTYRHVIEMIGVFAKHTPHETGAKILIVSENREGWIYAFYSIWEKKGIAVPVDATSTVEDIAYIMRDCQPQAVWTSHNKKELVKAAIIEAGVRMDVLIIDDFEHASLTLQNDDDVLLSQAEVFNKLHTGGDDTAVLIYTSGTTGSPKGVMLSYNNLYANYKGVSEEVSIFNGERSSLMLLPVHHILPLQASVIIPFCSGSAVAICPTLSGPDIMQSLCRGKVGIFVGVPRLWQTLYSGIMKKINASIVSRTLFAICKKVNNRKLSRFVFQSVHKKMGGHLDFCVSGGAALDKEIGEGLRTLGLDVLEGYGMTETAPIIAFTRPDDIIPGCVGLPLPSVECKIVNGELYAKGPNVMKGYYNRPEETTAVLDDEGFVHTGDLARFDEKGRIYITGRCKEIIVLSNGKNVQPNEIEYKIEKYEDIVKEAAVTQDSDMLAAIIVPQSDWASTRTDDEIEEELKRVVLEPYNKTVENYKKIMRLYVYRGDLPRTRLDKLKRFQLKDIISGTIKTKQKTSYSEPQYEEYQILKQYIASEKHLEAKPTDHIETDLAFDSLDCVELQGFIERTFGMTMNADTMASFSNITAMTEYIANQRTRIDVEKTDWSVLIKSDTSNLKLPCSGLSLRFLMNMFKSFLKVYNKLEINGTENIPADRPFILAPNHQSYIDTPIVMAGLSSTQIQNTYFYATEEHVRGKLMRFMAHNHNVVIMERGNLKDSILKLAEVLKRGGNICIFPEGSRTHDGKLAKFKKTFAILANELNIPIVPVRIEGAYDAMPRGTHSIERHPISITYLPTIFPSGENYDELSDKVRNAIDKK